MKIQEAKDLLSDLYKKSLFFLNVPVDEHPIRVVEASKSIVGIDPNNPIKKILNYCDNYVNQFKPVKETYKHEDLDLPLVVTYLDLELSLIENNRIESFANVFNLLKVSEGTQVLEFLLEFSLKYCSNTFFLIWAIYRMELFLGFENIKQSMTVCIEYILNDEKLKVERILGKDDSMDDYLTTYVEDMDTYKDFISLYRMYNNGFIRKDKINSYILSVIFEKYKFNKGLNRKMEILEDQRKYGRNWILSYLRSLDLHSINHNLILNLDAARGAIKILKNKKESEFIWDSLNRVL